MKVSVLWFGGPNYALPYDEDIEHFSSLKDAKEAFWRRCDNDPYYPCVNAEESCMWVAVGHVDHIEYPDEIVTMGPRGGIIVNRHV